MKSVKNTYALRFETMESRILLAADLINSPSAFADVDALFIAEESAVFSVRELSWQSISDSLELNNVDFENDSNNLPQMPEMISIGHIGSFVVGFSSDSTFLIDTPTVHDSFAINLGGDATLQSLFYSTKATTYDAFFESTDIRDELNKIDFEVIDDREIERIVERTLSPLGPKPADRIVVIVESQPTIDIAVVTKSRSVVSQATVGVERSPIGTIQSLVMHLPGELNGVTADVAEAGSVDAVDEVTPLEDSSTFRSQYFEFSTLESNRSDAVQTSQPTVESELGSLQRQKVSLQSAQANRQAGNYQHNRTFRLSQNAMWQNNAEQLEAFDMEMSRSYSQLPSLTKSLDAQLPDHLIDQEFEKMLAENGIISVPDSQSDEPGDDKDDGTDYARASRRVLSPILLITIPYVIHRRVRHEGVA